MSLISNRQKGRDMFRANTVFEYKGSMSLKSPSGYELLTKASISPDVWCTIEEPRDVPLMPGTYLSSQPERPQAVIVAGHHAQDSSSELFVYSLCRFPAETVNLPSRNRLSSLTASSRVMLDLLLASLLLSLSCKMLPCVFNRPLGHRLGLSVT